MDSDKTPSEPVRLEVEVLIDGIEAMEEAKEEDVTETTHHEP